MERDVALLNRFDEVIFIGNGDEIYENYNGSKAIHEYIYKGEFRSESIKDMKLRRIKKSADFYDENNKQFFFPIRKRVSVYCVYTDNNNIKNEIEEYKKDPDKIRNPPKKSEIEKKKRRTKRIEVDGKVILLEARKVERSIDRINWERFKGVEDAEIKTGVNNGNITSVCKGRRNVAGGYFWRYADDDIYVKDKMFEKKVMKDDIKCFVCGLNNKKTACTFIGKNMDIATCKFCCEVLAKKKINPLDFLPK